MKIVIVLSVIFSLQALAKKKLDCKQAFLAQKQTLNIISNSKSAFLYGGGWYASGFFIAPNLIVSSKHFVEEFLKERHLFLGNSSEDKIHFVTQDKIRGVASILAISPNLDIVLLKTRRKLKGILPLKFSKKMRFKPGSSAYLIGAPDAVFSIHPIKLISTAQVEKSLQKGLESSYAKFFSAPTLGERAFLSSFRSSLPVGPGASGGMIIDRNYEIIGMFIEQMIWDEPIKKINSESLSFIMNTRFHDYAAENLAEHTKKRRIFGWLIAAPYIQKFIKEALSGNK